MKIISKTFKLDTNTNEWVHDGEIGIIRLWNNNKFNKIFHEHGCAWIKYREQENVDMNNMRLELSNVPFEKAIKIKIIDENCIKPSIYNLRDLKHKWHPEHYDVNVFVYGTRENIENMLLEEILFATRKGMNYLFNDIFTMSKYGTGCLFEDKTIYDNTNLAGVYYMKPLYTQIATEEQKGN